MSNTPTPLENKTRSLNLGERKQNFCSQTINNRLIHTAIRTEVLPEVDSTNAYLLRQIKNKADIHGHAVIAQRQTQGKGRQGKTWVAKEGQSLPISLAWRFPKSMPLSALPLVVSLCVWQVLSTLGVPAQIKWPNDLMIEQAKLVGVLVESIQTPTESISVIGIGINLSTPKITDRLTLGIWDYNPLCDGNHLATLLLLALNQTLLQFEQHGFSLFKKAYLSACRDLGNPVVLWHKEAILAQGIMQSVTDEGALILRSDNIENTFMIGEVSLRGHNA